jgi:hypothetical protein
MKNSLFSRKPSLVKEWHPTKNGDITYGSGKKVWWICGKGHEWEARVLSRSHGSGCPYCSGNAVFRENCLATVNPTLAKEWHPTKNLPLTPNDITGGSNKRLWWVCKKGHEWQAVVADRNRGRGCPYCSRNLVSEDNCLQTVNPSLAKEWHFAKNGAIIPSNIAANSSKKVWWICNKGHVWQAKVADRNRGRRCPFCNSQTSQLELRVYTEMKYLFGNVNHRKKIKGVECDIYISSPQIAIEVDAFHWHKDKYDYDRGKSILLKKENIALFRVRESGLRRISKSDVFFSRSDTDFNILKRILHKILEKTTMRQDMTDRIKEYLRLGKIANEDEYLKLLDMLPAPLPGCSLQECNQGLAKEWHPTKNGSLTPKDVSYASGKKVWWICSKGHEWKTTVSHRNGGRRCPYCFGKRVHKGNSLQTVNPILAREWHPTKNGSLAPNNITANSSKKVWWICSKGHEWAALISNRNAGASCPFCSGRAAHEKNSLRAINPLLAREWHPIKNGALTPDNITANSSKKVWWFCIKNHEWQSRVSDRNRGAGCPYCAGKAACRENCLYTKNPTLAKEWHPTKNGFLTPNNVTPGSHSKVWWICSKGHEWQATVKNRNNGARCPYCARKKK